ncbi:MAG: ribosome-binding factor A [Hyphomicrobiales bacterium]|nr:MAG: ribosome-binding factor A [Hyphomicrobiales bacterium]
MAKSGKPGKGPSQRQLRVGELLRHELADIFSRQKIQDDVLEAHVITVTEVSISPDLRSAVAYILPLGGKGSKIVVKAARQHIPFIRSLLAKSINLKQVPLLNFEKDSAYDNSSHINEVLNNPHVQQDLQGDDDEGSESEE